MRADAMCAFPAARLAWLLVLAASAANAQRSQAPKGWQEFVSPDGGYVAFYPKSWHVLQPGFPMLYICNFPPSRRVRAVIVPENGATIGVISPPEGVSSIDQWIGRVSPAIRVRSRNSITLRMPEPAAPLRIEEVNYLSIEGPDCTSWYFEISGRLLKADLSYWSGDPKAEKYRQVLGEIIQTITPLAR